MRLEDPQNIASVRGIPLDAPVTMVSVQWLGSDALELIYKPGRQLAKGADQSIGVMPYPTGVTLAVLVQVALRKGLHIVPSRPRIRRGWGSLQGAVTNQVGKELTALSVGDEAELWLMADALRGRLDGPTRCRSIGAEYV